MRAVRYRGRLVDFLGNSGLVCQTDRLEDKQQSELEGLGKKIDANEASKNGFCAQLLIYNGHFSVCERHIHSLEFNSLNSLPYRLKA